MRFGNQRSAFTLLELFVVITVIAVLAVLTIAAVDNLRARAQRIQCTENLRALYIGAEGYLQQNGAWPQIAASEDSDTADQDYAAAWITALSPFGVPPKTWICPTEQELLGKPDFLKPQNIRVDYVATYFDDKPTSPHQWPRQPWFIETGDEHGNGNLIIFTDGSVSDLQSVVPKPSSSNP